ncbi:MAG: DNA polymerase Y family protein [Acidimicrobiales bacterium]
MRTLVVRCADWPVVAAGVPLDEAAAVVHANRVVATSPAAREHDVAVGQRRREAQARCPALVVLDHDPARDARAFEPIVATLDALTPRVELTEPGLVAFPTRGPSRFFGGDDALATRALAVVTEALAGSTSTPSASNRRRIDPDVRVGIADGAFVAALAASSARVDAATLVVPAGTSAAFLAGLPTATLERPALVEVWQRLGLRTLGAVAALPERDVLARFGWEGLTAWRLAGGLDEHPPALGPPPADLTVRVELDPPADTVAPAAFLARGLAEELHTSLWARGSACTRVVIGAETEHGEQLERVWRAEGALTAAAIADRLRWQLDGWLQGSARHRPTAGISRLWLTPEEIVPAGGRQLGFWGSDAATSDRASRAVARVQGLLGVGSVAVPEWRGSRDPATQIALVEAEAVDLTAERAGAHRDRVAGPWPGRLPAPSPAWVHHAPVDAEVTDLAGTSLRVSGRGELSGPPAQVSVAGGPWLAVVAWAGPWPLEERWWDSARHRRRARLQLVTSDGTARLVTLEAGTWHVEATYD